jgi:hypothetical protein
VWRLPTGWCFAARDFRIPLGAGDEHTRQPLGKFTRCSLAALTRTPKARSSSYNRVKFFVNERLHRLSADLSFRRQVAEAAQDFLFGVRAQDQDAVVSPQGPILTFDFHTCFRGNFIEGVRAIGGRFQVFRPRFGEAKQADVSGHNMPFYFLVGSLHFLSPPCDAMDSLRPDELN